MNKGLIGCLGVGAVILFILLIGGCGVAGSYNRLVGLQQKVDQSWAQVQNVYQRRADLIPNLVNTVQGAANFEKSTLTEVTNARASVGRVQIDPNHAPVDAAKLQEFQQAQGQLSNALSRLLVVSERYPELRATQNFQNLQAQLEGTEIESRLSAEISTAPSRNTTLRCALFRQTCSQACFGSNHVHFLKRKPAPRNRRR